MDLATRFWAKGSKVGSASHPDCWLWIGGSRIRGYGMIYVRRRMVRAHRLSWEMARGTIPDNLCVLHRCDVRACVNPNHLFLGTNAANIEDKIAKGRQGRGEVMPQAKLTAAQVAVIKSRIRGGDVQAQIAREHGVSTTTINGIALGRDWKHVAAAEPVQLLLTG